MSKALEDENSGVSSSKVLEQLRDLILEGEYKPKKRLVEGQLAEKLGVSRTPIRQALTMLEIEGLVEIVPNRGAMVRSFDINEVWDTYELRAVLEGYAARRAAGYIEDTELENLTKISEEMGRLDTIRFSSHEEEIRWLVERNQEFHGKIIEASHNQRLQQLAKRTVEVPLVFKSFYWYTPYERSISKHYHSQILRALETGDSERAEIVMREHVYEGRDFVIKALRVEDSVKALS